MHDVLRTRILRKLESLPEDQVYQVLDYMEFLESKYAPDLTTETTAFRVSRRSWRTSFGSGR